MVSTSINGKLYFQLYQLGGDKLISVYLILKASKDKRRSIINPIIKSGKTIKHFRLLKLKTGLSEPTLKKYIPKLESLGICRFTDNGGFYLMGNNKTRIKFSENNFFKIEVSTLTETVLNVFAVRLHNKYIKQQKAIDKTAYRIKVLAKAERNFFLSSNELKTFKKLNSKGISISDLQNREKTALSNEGFALLKTGREDVKMVGFYWKQKLVKNKIIQTKRDFQFIAKMSYLEYLSLKRNTSNYKLTFKNGKVFEELISEYVFRYIGKKK